MARRVPGYRTALVAVPSPVQPVWRQALGGSRCGGSRFPTGCPCRAVAHKRVARKPVLHQYSWPREACMSSAAMRRICREIGYRHPKVRSPCGDGGCLALPGMSSCPVRKLDTCAESLRQLRLSQTARWSYHGYHYSMGADACVKTSPPEDHEKAIFRKLAHRETTKRPLSGSLTVWTVKGRKPHNRKKYGSQGNAHGNRHA